jgi:hypothetical protein
MNLLMKGKGQQLEKCGEEIEPNLHKNFHSLHSQYFWHYSIFFDAGNPHPTNSPSIPKSWGLCIFFGGISAFLWMC